MRDPKFNSFTYNAVSTTVATGQTNRDIRANEAELRKDLDPANVMIISTDQTITLRLNSSTSGAIVMTATESPKRFEYAKIKNLYVTNAS